jgi:nucleotide-binding universal stress UspA family protein
VFGRIALGFDGTEQGYDALALGELLARAGGGSLVPTFVVPRQPPFDGNPSVQLANAAAETGVMVVGSRGYGPMRHALLGSVSAKLMRICPAPLLVVPRGGHAG